MARHIGKETAWRRLGPTEYFIHMFLDMDRDNKKIVATAFGMMDELLLNVDGVFEY